MKKRLTAAVMAAAVAATALTGCGGGGSASDGGASGGNGGAAAPAAEAPTEPFGDTVKYDPSAAINDGKDITVDVEPVFSLQ